MNNANSSKIITRCSCCGYKGRFRKGFFFWNFFIFELKRYRNPNQRVICPRCGSLPRHRIIASWCEQNLAFLKNKKILIFAPEKSMMNYLKKRQISVVTADLYNRADMKLDIQDTGLDAGSFDIVFCNHVLEHVDDYKKALQELLRIIAPDGMLICSFPIDMTVEHVREGRPGLTRWEHISMFGQYDHNRLFGRDSGELIEEAGFDVECIDIQSLPPEILPVTGPADYDTNMIFLCRKAE